MININIFGLVLILLLSVGYIFYSKEPFSQRENNDIYNRHKQKPQRKGLLPSLFFKIEKLLQDKSKKGNIYCD